MFERFASWVDDMTSRAVTFAAAVLVIVVWAASGPFFHFSDTWQLVINTGTTIVTFLMVFLLQNSQRRATDRHYHLTEKIAALDGKHELLLTVIRDYVVKEEEQIIDLSHRES